MYRSRARSRNRRTPMHTVLTTVRTLTAALSLPRLMIALALAVALVAIPAFRPDDASAMRMSERTASRLCANAGGSMYYDFADGTVYMMTCTLPSGNQFNCAGSGGGTFGNMVDC